MKKVLFGLVLLMVMLPYTTGAFAEPATAPAKLPEKAVVQEKAVVRNSTQGQEQDPLERLEEVMTDDDTGDIAFGAMTPVLKIGGIVFIILGIILTVGSVGYLAVCFVKALFGKNRVGKSHLGLAGAALFFGVLLLGGGIFGILKFGKNVGVDPVNDKILDPGVEIVSSAVPKATPETK